MALTPEPRVHLLQDIGLFCATGTAGRVPAPSTAASSR